MYTFHYKLIRKLSYNNFSIILYMNIIDVYLINKPKKIEEFSILSGGDSMTIGDSVTVKKSFENNQKINNSMVVESLNKIFNDVTNDVIQKNTAVASSAAGASNVLFLSGIKCKNVVISNVNQDSSAYVDTQSQIKQTNLSKVATEVSTNIDKKIEQSGGIDLGALQDSNTKQLNDFMNAMPGYDPNKAQKLASECPGGGSLISVGNDCNINTSYELDANVRQSLELDESFRVNDTNEVSNTIKNTIDQTNFASCEANASAGNKIILQDLKCSAAAAADTLGDDDEDDEGSLTIRNINQKAVAELYQRCVFDQSSTSNIVNKMMNTIKQKYNKIYDAIADKAKEKERTQGPAAAKKYYDDAGNLVDLLAAAGTEKILAAADNLPQSSPSASTPSPSARTPSPSASTPSPSARTPSPTASTPSPSGSIAVSEESSIMLFIEQNKTYLMWGGIALAIIIVIIILLSKKNDDDDSEDN